jgi:hypothetical protein
MANVRTGKGTAKKRGFIKKSASSGAATTVALKARVTKLEKELKSLKQAKQEMFDLLSKTVDQVLKLSKSQENRTFIPLESELADIEGRLRRCPSK